MKIAVIGAGASGMLFSIEAAKAGHNVTVFEKNEKCGKKLYITGKGRCNLLNLTDNETILKNVVTNPKFMYAPLSKFSAEDTYRYFEALGLPLKTERGNRVFPVSDKSSDVITALKRSMDSLGVKIVYKTEVLGINIENDILCGIITRGKTHAFDAVVVATGGKTYPATGSTGDGYKFAETLGHTVLPQFPALSEMYFKSVEDVNGKRIQYDILPFLEGLSLKNVSLTALNGKKVLVSEFGEMLFTKNGVSGPIALTLSSHVTKSDITNIKLVLDLKPALSEEQLDKRLLREMDDNKNKFYKNLMVTLLPSKMIPFFIELSKISADKETRNITKEERKSIVGLLKNMTLCGISVASFLSAVVTSGGVCVKEINPKTMESKLIKNLYFIGEVLDVDALTGGFNLQLAFSTAYSAAQNLQSGENNDD